MRIQRLNVIMHDLYHIASICKFAWKYWFYLLFGGYPLNSDQRLNRLHVVARLANQLNL